MLTTPDYVRINPAITSGATEVYQHDKQLFFINNGKRGTWAEMPPELLAIFSRQLVQDTPTRHHLQRWAKEQPIDILKQYVQCNFGGYDGEPDVDENGSLQICEYHNCGSRGHCRYEGKVCRSLTVAHGILTKAELQILSLAHQPNKLIADRLFVSIETVNSHLKSLTRKTGYSRPGLVQFAIIKGINS